MRQQWQLTHYGTGGFAYFHNTCTKGIDQGVDSVAIIEIDLATYSWDTECIAIIADAFDYSLDQPAIAGIV